MPFKTAVQAYLDTLDPDSLEFKVLNYLHKNGIGSSKAKSWGKIQEFAKVDSDEYSKEDFQNGLLAKSRQNKFFICSNNRGYYIPESINDITVAKHYYESRIESMLSNLNNLLAVSQIAYPETEFKCIDDWLAEALARIHATGANRA
ncbi:MAG: hypothetical protein NDI58_00440 [Geothrix sp.]|nr:hypothetical protein [Geothrix sp.]